MTTSSRTRSRRARRLAAGCATTALLALAPAAAHAAPPSSAETYGGTESGTVDECGFPVEFEDTFSGRYTLRTVEGSGGELLLTQDTFRYRSVLTNPATGASMVIRGNGVSRDLTAQQVGSALWEVTGMHAGQPFVVEDSSGNVILRDRGNLRTWSLVDTSGDEDPEIVDFGITAIRGSFVGPDLDFCELLTHYIG